MGFGSFRLVQVLANSIDDFQCDPEGQEKPGEDLEAEFFVHN
jgi:hypothetical protein